MKTVKNVLCRLGLIYLLLAVNILPCAGVIPDVFPARNLSAVYLLALSVCLVLYYAHRVSGEGNLPYMMKALSWMAFFLLLLRGVKYGVFAGVGVLARHTWYLYYVPMLGLPLFFFGVSLLVSHGENAPVPKKWFPFAGITVLFILLVLTNDLHGLVFRFRPGFENWNSDYTWGPLFYAVAAWQAILYLSAILLLVGKCRIGSAKKYALLTLVPFAVGISFSVLLMTGTMPRPNGAYLVKFPETLISTVAGVLECCMGLGLIPTNKNYAKLFGVLSISAQITDRAGKAVYRSDSAVGLTPEQFLLPDWARLVFKDPVPPDLSGEQRNLFLSAAREALANAAKHAGAENMEISFSETQNAVGCAFTSDGRLPAGEIRFTGGLYNLSVLAEKQGAKVRARVGEGFTLSLLFPKTR